MWGRAMGGARLLPLLLLLLPGAVGLECLSCGAEDGTCRGAVNVTCPPESDVCAEALVAVTWSHGRWALGGRGCGRGRGGAVGRAVELWGVVVFARRRQCRGRGCNGLLPIGGEGALPLPGNASERVPNGLQCYGCHDDGRCAPPTVVQCYGDLRGCFHGNVSLTLGGATVWREVRGCARDTACREEVRGDGAVGLRGSCCAGALCNGPSPNKTFFAPDLPRLELLPHPQPLTPAPATKMADGATKMADGATKMADGATAKMADRLPAPVGGAPEADGSRGGLRGAANPTEMAAAPTEMTAGTTEMAAAPTEMAAAPTKMAAAPTKMAAGPTGVNGVNGGVNGVNGGVNGVNGGVNGVNVNLADANMAAVDPNMAAVDPDGAVDPNMAALDPDGAAGDKMAAGRAGSGRAQGGAKGRGHPIGGPGWLLPLLLLPLL